MFPNVLWLTIGARLKTTRLPNRPTYDQASGLSVCRRLGHPFSLSDDIMHAMANAKNAFVSVNLHRSINLTTIIVVKKNKF
jgi:hypothetical protein